MLAYVFWHWRRDDVAASEYEQAQRRFHAALRDAPSAGFSRSHSAALRGAPWAAGGGEAYEDWYLVDVSAALDPLNTAAITASRAAPHDAAAALAAGGAAGLYTLRGGRALNAGAPRHAQWFSKPAGMSYAALDAALAEVLQREGAALWMRYMVLGPTPEFCLQSRTPVMLPTPFTALPLQLRPVWPG
jgi:hypothetical protein